MSKQTMTHITTDRLDRIIANPHKAHPREIRLLAAACKAATEGAEK